MKIKRNTLISLSLLLVLIVIYCVNNRSGSFDDFIFKGVNKEYINQIRIEEHYSEEDKKVLDKKTIQDILSEFSKLNLRECRKNIPKEDKVSYDIRFSNGNQYISYDGTDKILDVQITFYNSGYITFYGEGTLKSKYYKICNSSKINDIEELIGSKEN